MSILSPDLTVHTFGDAVGVALALADDYAYVNAGLIIAPDGRVAALRLAKLHGSEPFPTPGAFWAQEPAERTTNQGAGRWPYPTAATSDGIDTIVWWFLQQPHRWPTCQPIGEPSGRSLIVSVRASELGSIDTAQRMRYQHLRTLVGLSGRPLLDWIETDGDCIRSLAYLDDATSAWPTDRPPIRQSAHNDHHQETTR